MNNPKDSEPAFYSHGFGYIPTRQYEFVEKDEYEELNHQPVKLKENAFVDTEVVVQSKEVICKASSNVKACEDLKKEDDPEKELEHFKSIIKEIVIKKQK